MVLPLSAFYRRAPSDLEVSPGIQDLRRVKLVGDCLIVKVPDVRRLAGGGPVPAGPDLHVPDDLWLAVDLDELPSERVGSTHQPPGHLQDVLKE